MNYEVIDNFLDNEDFLRIKNKIMDNNFFAWFFMKNVAIENITENNNAFYFVHTFFENWPNDPPKGELSPYFKDLNPLIDKMNIKDLWRIKANMYPNQNKFIEHQSHADYDTPHQSAIFYINNNNGFTRLEDGTKIESVENRMLFFEGHKLHNSTNCTDEQVRVNINFNYLRS